MKNSVKNVRRTASKTKPKQVRVVSSPHQAPSAQSNVIRKLGRPKITNLGEAGDIIVIHREYISDLLANATAGAFAIAGIPINPGNIAMFPWLSGIASNFETYVFRKLKFLFETSAPTSTPGTVLMAVDYDRNDPLPSDKSTMMSLRDATRSAAWERNTLDCCREDLHKRKTYFVGESNTTGLPIAAGQQPEIQLGSDDRLDDAGEFLIASSNSTAGAALGELYVEYEVCLQTPQGNSTPEDYFSAQKGGSSVSITASNPFGSDAQFTNDGVDTYIYPGLGVVYITGGGASYFLFTEVGTYSYSVTFENANNMVNSTISSDVVGGNAGYNSINVMNTAGTVSSHTGLFVVRNTTPQTFMGSVNSFSGYLGYLALSVNTLSKSSYRARIRLSRLPDYDSNRVGSTGVVTLGVIPSGRMTKRRRRRRDVSPEILVLNVAGNGHDSSESEKPRHDTCLDCSVSPAEFSPLVRGGNPMLGVRTLK